MGKLLDSQLILSVEMLSITNESTKRTNELRGLIIEAFEYLKSAKHVNLCKYTDILRLDGTCYMLVSEGYSMSLSNVLNDVCNTTLYGSARSNNGYNQLDFIKIINQIMCGLQYLHSLGIPHGNLTLDNIAITSDGNAKICGYGQNYLNIVAYSSKELNCGSNSLEFYKSYTSLNKITKNDYRNVFVHHKDYYRDKNLFFTSPDVLMFYNECKNCEIDLFSNDIWSLGICTSIIISCILGMIKLNYISSNEIKFESIESIYNSGKYDCNNHRIDTILDFDSFNIYNKVSKTSEDGIHESFIFISSLLHLFNLYTPEFSDISAVGLDISGIYNSFFNGSNSEYDMYEMFGNIRRMSPDDTGTDISKLSNLKMPTDTNNGEDSSLKSTEFKENIELVIDFITGRSIFKELLYITHNQSFIENYMSISELYYLLAISHECLKINRTKRPTVIDLLGKHELLSYSDQFKSPDSSNRFSWVCAKRCIGEVTTNNTYNDRIISCIEEPDNSILKYDIKLDDLFYYWTLLGNDPLNILTQNPCKSQSLKHENLPNIFKKYGYGPQLGHDPGHFKRKIFLDDLMEHIKTANLFPMVIEHQLRPSCVYARQYCFIYQWLRIRRFLALLIKPSDNRRQILIESRIDIPPLIRKYIWCVVLGVTYTTDKMAAENLHDDYSAALISDILKVVSFYDNDLLYSRTAIIKLLWVVKFLKERYALSSIPSFIYSFCIPLLLMYHDSELVLKRMIEKIFVRHLKELYISAGTFVNTYLCEFTTVLNFFDPEIAFHLRVIGAYANSYALPWFMTLFADKTSVNHTYLIWDTIFIHPKQFIKYLAVVIIHSIRERLLEINNAHTAISFITSVVDSLNIPMLNYLATHVYTSWSDILRSKKKPLEESDDEVEALSLDKNTFVFISQEYPLERCFKISYDAFSAVFDRVLVVDLRSIESYDLGHIKNSIHVTDVVTFFDGSCKRSNALSLSLFNTKSDLPETNLSRSQICSNLHKLHTQTRTPWLHNIANDNNKIILAVGDGYDLDTEMMYLQHLIYEFYLQHVCYYKISADDWVKIITL